MELIKTRHCYFDDTQDFPSLSEYWKYFTVNSARYFISKDGSRILYVPCIFRRNFTAHFIVNAKDHKLLSATMTTEMSEISSDEYDLIMINEHYFSVGNTFICTQGNSKIIRQFVVGSSMPDYKKRHNKSNATRYVKIALMKSRLIKLIS